MMDRFARLSTLLIISFTLFACGKQSSTDELPLIEEAAQLSGEVFYRERIMLPPDSVLIVKLVDVSIADARSITLSEIIHPIQGGPPYEFTLDYTPSVIDDKMRYSLQARVEHDGKLLMISDTALDPFRQNGPFNIMLVSASSSLDDAVSNGASNLNTISSVNPLVEIENTYWKLITLGDTNAFTPQGEREPHFILRGSEQGAGGSSGCNMFNGGYETDGNDLSFAPLAMTRKMCHEGNEQEMLFMQALEQARHFSINEHDMTLFNEDKMPIATFKAMHFN